MRDETLEPLIRDPDDRLIPDPEVQRRYSVTAMTLWRWDHDKSLEFPPAIRIRNRKYRSAKALAEFERKRAAVAEVANIE